MGNSFKFIYIVAIMIVVIIVVTMGLFVIWQTQGFVTSTKLDTTQISEFNNKWTGYDKLQKGSSLRSLFQKLAKNAKENSNIPQMLIDVAYNTTEGSDYTIIKSTVKNPNISAFERAIDDISVQHAYTVEFIYNEETGIITGIIIKNSRTDKVSFTPDER